LYAASAASFAKNSNRGGGAMKKRKKVNKKKKIAQSRQIDTLWSNIFEDEPARMTPSKKGNSNNRGMVVRRNDANTNDPELVALLNSLNISMSSDDDDDVDLSDLISFGDDTDDDDDSDGDDDSDEDSAGQFYQQAVQTLQSDKAVRANLGGKVRVGPIMSQNSTTEYGTGRSAQTSHQYTFSVSGSKGRASARLHVNADRTSWVDLELFRGQTLTIPLESNNNNNNGSSNNINAEDNDDETTAEVLSTNSFGRRFKRVAHHWDDPSDIVEAEIVEKGVRKHDDDDDDDD
jgi:hypothetical protein